MSDVLKVLKEVFGYSALRPGQNVAIEALLSGRNVFAVMPTGAGKSLCFQVPALVRGGLTIVVSPLIALMSDQVANLQLLGVKAAALNSAQNYEQNVDIWKQAAAGDLNLLYISPERLMTARMLAAVQRLNPSFFAVDEVHCMSQWGADFRPDYAQLSQLKALFPDTPIIGLTATADTKTREDIKFQLFGKKPVELVTGFDRPNLCLMVQQRQSGHKQLDDFLEARRGQSGIVYCLSRKKTEEIAYELNQRDRPAIPYHAGLENNQKSVAMERFMSEPGVIIVATIAFGMGIDKPDIRFVAHADLPGNMEAYYQEIGRAGRDGKPADCLMLWGGNDLNQRRRFIAGEGTEEHQRLSQQRLNALMAYVDASSCRRAALLRYFGDPQSEIMAETGCGNCDMCLNPVETHDETASALQVADAIRQTGMRFGIAHICDVLRGTNSEKVQNFGHDKLAVFGVGKNHSANHWRAITRQMQSAGLLEIDLSNYSRACITPRLAELGNGNSTFQFNPVASNKSSGNSISKGKKRQDIRLNDLNTQQDQLLTQLKQARRELAAERNVPAFVIFADRSLIDMVMKRPSTKAEFNQVDGVGAAKLEAFGDIFLQVINSSD